MGKVASAIAAMILCVSATGADPRATYPHDEKAIVLVKCYKPGGVAAGSAFKVTRNGYITAAHVTNGGECFIGFDRVTVTHTDDKHDYATFIGPESDAVLDTDCGGFTAGEVYVARGYPGGIGYNIWTPWLAVSNVQDGFQAFLGEGIPGMSGGPVMDESGAAVGIVSKRWPTRSMPLRSTSFCG